MPDHQADKSKQQVDNTAIKRYFENPAGGTAATVSMMAHEHNLPASATAYRLQKEIRNASGWLDKIDSTASVLDLGCGAGTWTEIFGKRYKSVIGIEQSSMMAKAARERLTYLSNIRIVEGDVRHTLPEGRFELIFLGGLCMYLNDHDVVELLCKFRSRLTEGGSIILRESTVHQGVHFSEGAYQAVYRSVHLYHKLFDRSGAFHVEVKRNYGYTNLVTAEELVNLRRKWLPFLSKDSTALGSLTWWMLRGMAPISFWALPRILAHFNIQWPRLQNHFFRLSPVK